MSLLLKDRVYTMEAPTAKRGVYPLHGYKLGLYRLPIKLDEPIEIQSVHDGMKNTFAMDTYADRIYATYSWKEENMPDPDAKGYEQVELNITVEIVTGEVVDIIYQIFPIKKLEEMTPLAKIVPDAKPIPVIKEEKPEAGGKVGQEWKGGGIKPGPIDVEYKSKMGQSAPFKTPANYPIKTWGRVGADNGIMGVWGEFVSVDYDICIADGGCIDACPVNVYEWFDTPGNPASEKKPLMAREPDCIFCLACEGVCPPQAIKIFEMK